MGPHPQTRSTLSSKNRQSVRSLPVRACRRGISGSWLVTRGSSLGPPVTGHGSRDDNASRRHYQRAERCAEHTLPLSPRPCPSEWTTIRLLQCHAAGTKRRMPGVRGQRPRGTRRNRWGKARPTCRRFPLCPRCPLWQNVFSAGFACKKTASVAFRCEEGVPQDRQQDDGGGLLDQAGTHVVDVHCGLDANV